MEIRESEIRDILAQMPELAQKVMGLEFKADLYRKEYSLSQGRLDLLFISGDRFHLVELKTTKGLPVHVDQVMAYKEQLEEEKTKKRLPNLKVTAYLACPRSLFPEITVRYCKEKGVIPVELDVSSILHEFLTSRLGLTGAMRMKPTALNTAPFILNKMLYYLRRRGAAKAKELAQARIMQAEHYKHRKPEWLINANYFRLGSAFKFLARRSGKIELTELGRNYVDVDPSVPKEMSDLQARFIREKIIRNPFASGIVYGIYSLAESIFELSKNTFQVPKNIAVDYFVAKIGKVGEWLREETRRDQFYRYSRFAQQLGLIAIAGDYISITPTGVTFVTQLQLYRALEMLSPA